MSSQYSTITSNVNLLLVDTRNITAFSPYITYVSSVSLPGRIATIRDATGNCTSNNNIIVSTTKNVYFADGTNSISIKQPFGYISLSSRDTNTWDIINTFAFPNPEGNTNVSSIYVNGNIDTNFLNVKSYISTAYLNTASISTNNLKANMISTTNLETTNILTQEIVGNTIQLSSLRMVYTISNITSSIQQNLAQINLLDQGANHLTLNYGGVPTIVVDYSGSGNIDEQTALINQKYISFNYCNTGGFNLLILPTAIDRRLAYQSYDYLTNTIYAPRAVAADWSYYPAEQYLNMNNNNISNVSTIYNNSIY